MLSLLSSCKLCPHQCKVNRLKGEKGFCNAGQDAVVYSSQIHMGEEPPISAKNGSGTIFFSHCNSRCVYCQNYIFSQSNKGRKVNAEELSFIMLELQKQGVHNINLVTPTHYVPQIIIAVKKAKMEGLNIPIIYNTNGYELPETLYLLNGIVDIYLTDMRYSNSDIAMRYSSLSKYVFHNRKAVKIMQEQVGDLIIDKGIAKKGVIIRLLVLPNQQAGILDTMQFLKKEISANIYISLMEQYYPTYKAKEYPEINRRITYSEYKEAVDIFNNLGFENGWIQERHTSQDCDRFLGVNFNPSNPE